MQSGLKKVIGTQGDREIKRILPRVARAGAALRRALAPRNPVDDVSG